MNGDKTTAIMDDEIKIILRKSFSEEPRLECIICTDCFENDGFGFAMLSEDNQLSPVCPYCGKEKAPELYRIWQQAMKWKEWSVSKALKEMAQQVFEATEPDVAKRVITSLNKYEGMNYYQHDSPYDIPFPDEEEE
ncbi:MAG TPA: hypothetical protein PKZ42_10415 [Syntrophales bacterium]|nr:hypothetical protein [Syntrophales bacterium]